MPLRNQSGVSPAATSTTPGHPAHCRPPPGHTTGLHATRRHTCGPGTCFSASAGSLYFLYSIARWLIGSDPDGRNVFIGPSFQTEGALKFAFAI